MLFSALRAYHITIKYATGFMSFHLVHRVEAFLPIECEIPTIRTEIELLLDANLIEQRFLILESLNEGRQSSLPNNEATKKSSKAIFNCQVNLWSFTEGDLVLAYHITHDMLGCGEFESLWRVPYIVFHYLTKDAYILSHPEGYTLKDPVNGSYLKKLYP